MFYYLNVFLYAIPTNIKIIIIFVIIIIIIISVPPSKTKDVNHKISTSNMMMEKYATHYKTSAPCSNFGKKKTLLKQVKIRREIA